MAEAAVFQQAFGALLAGRGGHEPDAALERALTVHRNTSTKAAVDALCDNFPVVRALLGEEAFTAVALDHIVSSPPADPRLCLYGASFPATLRNHPALAAFGYAAEVAVIERMVVEALFAADAEAVTPDALASGIDLTARFEAHPAVRLARFETPAAAIWQAHQPGSEATLGELAWEGQIALVTRPASEVSVQAIDAATFRFIGRLSAGVPLGEAAADVEPARLPGIFSLVLTAGVLVARARAAD